jgi:hypothetical protein
VLGSEEWKNHFFVCIPGISAPFYPPYRESRERILLFTVILAVIWTVYPQPLIFLCVLSFFSVLFSVSLIDSQSVKTIYTSENRGYDGGKKS